MEKTEKQCPRCPGPDGYDGCQPCHLWDWCKATYWPGYPVLPGPCQYMMEQGLADPDDVVDVRLPDPPA